MKATITFIFLILIGLYNLVAQSPNDFVTTWKTDNPGTSGSTFITIPTYSGETYSYDVDWDNDGTFDEFGITGDITHNFGTAGTYTIRIQGTFPRIYFNNGGDRRKLLSVDQWGTNPWTSMEGAFMGCWNMRIYATDTPDLSGVTSMIRMFQRCDVMNDDISGWDVSNVSNMKEMFYSALAFNQPLDSWDVGNVTDMSKMFRNSPFNKSLASWDVSHVTNMGTMFQDNLFFNQDISGWNVSQVTDMFRMFRSAASFNIDLSNWDISNVTNMSEMFYGVTLSTANYDAMLNGWSALTLQNNVTFDGGNSQYCNGLFSREYLIDNFNWVITDGGITPSCNLLNHFVTSWKTDNPGGSKSTSITIPTTGSGYNYDVDWNNDGVFDQVGVTSSVTHDFGVAGTYTVRIRGAFPRIYFNNGGDREKLLSVDQWGTIAWSSMEGAFHGCSNMNVTATDSPDLSTVNSMATMFRNCTVFNADLNTWDVSNITDYFGTFMGAASFNGNIGSWLINTTDPVTMAGMFNNAITFNRDISGWNVGTVTDMSSMFDNAQSFNQPIGTWNTANVTDMYSMFYRAMVFNQSLNTWDVSQVTDMEDMFYDAVSFNGAIGNWNTGNVLTMYEMFYGATAFNQPIGNWNTSKITNMGSMFGNAAAFNQDIGNWMVSQVTGAGFYETFNGAASFNQDISNWDVSGATNMTGMFRDAVSFDQDLGGWDVSNATNMSNMFTGVTLSTANYDALLIGWAAQPLKMNVTFSAGNSQFCTGATARQDIIASFGWNISDWGTSCGSTDDFLTIWKTNNPGTSSATSVTIPTFPGETYSYDVDWENDGTFDQIGVTGDAMHDYGVAGTYVIRIRGTFPRIYFNNGGDREKLLSVDQWGAIAWSSMESAFNGCGNMTVTATDSPDLSTVTSMAYMFRNCTIFNADLNTWDVSNITNYNNTFFGAASFNGNIGSWLINTNDPVTMEGMFYQAIAFNQDISGWSVGTVTDMSSMFENAQSFNQPIGAWNTANVIDMYSMFHGALAFNQSLNNWNVSQVTNMEGIFTDAVSFNGAIGNWNTGNALTMYEMFLGATAFNQPIGNWNLSNVTTIGGMFKDAASFNQDIGNWNVSQVTGNGFYDTFNGAASFNQDISNWDMSGATNLTNMFLDAVSFDQDLGNWDVSNVTNMSNMFTGATLSTANYDALLIGWSALPLQNGVVFNGGGSTYCAGESARTDIITNFGWTITDGGLQCPASLQLNLSLFLEGPFNGTSMNTDLNTNNLVPLNQPYNTLPWNYIGTESVITVSANAVDWVLLELRDAADAASATNATIIGQQAAFVLSDGSVVATDGSSYPEIAVTVAQNLFIVIYHRNHIGVMTSGPVSESGGLYSWDFTTSLGQAYGGSTGYKEIGSGIWGMVGGDGNADGQINNGDKIDIWAAQAGSAGYRTGDFNLDAQVNNGDKNEIWIPNTGMGGQVPEQGKSILSGPVQLYKCQVPE